LADVVLQTDLPVVIITVDTRAAAGRLSAQQTVYVLYIVLAAADLILVLLSIILLYGDEPVS